MKAFIQTIDPDGHPVNFESPDVELEKLLPLLPKIKAKLTKAGYRLVEDRPHPAAPVEQIAAGMFPAEEMKATIDDGKVYWKIRGGQYRKFGVIVWPEVLEAAGLKDLDPLKPVDLTGYMAHYVTKEDGGPQKVVRLERVN